MGGVTNEPSMEDILSSIKKIIAEDSAKPQGFTRARTRSAERTVEANEPAAESFDSAPEMVDADDDILELTQSAPIDMPAAEQPAPVSETVEAPMPANVAPQQAAVEAPAEAPIVSTIAVEASRHALASLSKMVVKPEVAGSDTLEGMVRDMLKPMLKDWLDANLPEIVERMVAQEVARISGR
jgi:cell pole-organizing protein PopZ